MKTKLFFFFFSLFFMASRSQNISGIINSYTGVTSVGSQSVSVISSSGFNTNDRILIIQMKGATINTSNNTSFGTILNYNDAGNYELATIASVIGTTISFNNPLLRTYTASGFVQLVKVPTYTNVVVTGLLTCSPWNGTTGGVLAFEASGTITLNSNIDVTNNGFLGGALSNGAITACAGDTFDYVLNSSTLAAGLKGEGIVNPNPSLSNGKGAYANGGGSGNDCNGGGAGGGNYGLGGHGGDPKVNVSCPPFFYENAGGYWGKNLLYSNASNKIFLGGGGGCGHQNNSAGSAGVSGGGIVLIRAASLSGNSKYIKSDGGDNNVVAGIDGQGGGGAGGTVLFDVCSINSLNVSVKGGKGGLDNFNGSDCHGKGGGGGGGIIWASSSLSGITSFLTGGLPGIFTNSASLCYNNSNGATAGQAGGTLTGLVIPGSMFNNVIIDTTICANFPVQLNAPSSASYTWSTGSNTQTITVNNTGTYWVQILPTGGCMQTDTFHVAIINPTAYDVLKDTSVCSTTGFVLNASSSGATNYNWSTGATTSSITATTSGIYWVDLSTNQCTFRDSATITILNTPVVILTNYTVCAGQSVNIIPTVVGGTGTYNYNWGNGNTNATYSTTPTSDSLYSLSVTDANGCSTPVSTGSITVLAPLNVNVSGTTICTPDTAKLLAVVTGGNGNYIYTWSPSNSHQNPLVVNPQTTTIYTVTVFDACSAINATDTAQVSVTSAPTISLPPIVSGCKPVCINLNNIPYNSLSNWQWDYGDNSHSAIAESLHCYTNSGSYNISFTYTTSLGCVKTVTSNSIVTVFSFPHAAFSASTFETDIFNTDIHFYNQSAGYITSQWNFGDVTGSTAQNPSHLYQSINDYYVMLIVENSKGCADTIVHELIIRDIFTFYAPNTFSPNYDQTNDVFLPTGTGWDNSSFRFWVFDRWGNLVLATTDPYKGWDGIEKGQIVQEDAYVWKVELKDVFGKSHTYSGIISLIK